MTSSRDVENKTAEALKKKAEKQEESAAAAAVDAESEDEEESPTTKKGKLTNPPSVEVVENGIAGDAGPGNLDHTASDLALQSLKTEVVQANMALMAPDLSPGKGDQKQEEDKCNLIINYLPPSFTENDVMHYFSPYGVIQNCKVVMDLHSGKSKGYGFVKYSNAESAAKALEALNGYAIKNKVLKVAVARKHCKEIRNSNLYVTHLPKHLDNDGLAKIFKGFGKLIECRVLKDKQGRCRGVGFVRFDKHDHAVKAMQALNKTTPPGWQRELRMKLASKRHDYPMPGSPWGPYGMPFDWWSSFYPPTPRSARAGPAYAASPRGMMGPWGHPPSPSPRSSRSRNVFFGHGPTSPGRSHRLTQMRESPRVARPPAFGYPSRKGSFSGGFYPGGGEYPFGAYPPHYMGAGGRPPFGFNPNWGSFTGGHPAMWDSFSPRGPRGRGGRPYSTRTPRRSTTAVVTNLADDTDENDLLKLFKELNIQSCKVVRTAGRGKNKATPHAFLNFNSYKNAYDALKKDGQVVHGHPMKIHLKQ